MKKRWVEPDVRDRVVDNLAPLADTVRTLTASPVRVGGSARAATAALANPLWPGE